MYFKCVSFAKLQCRFLHSVTAYTNLVCTDCTLIGIGVKRNANFNLKLSTKAPIVANFSRLKNWQIYYIFSISQERSNVTPKILKAYIMEQKL